MHTLLHRNNKFVDFWIQITHSHVQFGPLIWINQLVFRTLQWVDKSKPLIKNTIYYGLKCLLNQLVNLFKISNYETNYFGSNGWNINIWEMDKKIIMVNLLTNVFISGLYILQIQEIEIASDTKNLLQFIII